jgi:hypothetical protein
MPGEVYNWIREVIAGVVANKITETGPVVSEGERATLFLEVQDLPHDVADIFRRRYRDAIERRRENHFVGALLRIPSDRRKEVLIKLSRENDEDFEQVLTLLNPELGRNWETIIRTASKLDKQLGQFAETVLRPIAEGLKRREEERTGKPWWNPTKYF